MKLVTFEIGGKASYGCLAADKIIDLGSHFGQRFGDLRAVLARIGRAVPTRTTSSEA